MAKPTEVTIKDWRDPPQAERASFENLGKLRHRVEGLNWREVIAKPGVAEKLKDLLEAIEAKA